MEKEILVRYERCLACKSCELACAVSHSASKTLLGALAEESLPQKRIYVDRIEGRNLTITCRHCEEAYCIDACISGAMHRSLEGQVTNEGGPQKCIGCWMCVMVCPYGVISSARMERRALKCDRNCLDETGTPACVGACPTGALVFTEVEEYEKTRRRQYASKDILGRGGINKAI
ncbi:MAG: 4Fe-4S dicluster domain-containing protein [Bacillota bacterium]